MATQNYWEMQRPQQTVGAVAGLPGFGVAGVAGTAVRQPTGDELVKNQLSSLLAGDSQYIQNARTRGAKQAASRGLLNSSLASAASEASAINSALPIASQDAQAFSAANAQNQNDLNAASLMRYRSVLENQPSQSVGGGYVGGNAIDSQIDHDRRLELMREQSRLEREGAREDRSWRSGESAAEREWRTGESGLDRGMTREGWQFESGERGRDREFQRTMAELGWGFDLERDDRRMQFEDYMFDRESGRRDREMWQTMFGGAFGTALNTVMSDPSYFRDPQAAFGFMEGWGSQLMRMFSQYGIGPRGG